ncbi:DEKNAAC103659 [Brettanomyces naardenensis]|uniref:Succinate dehydrogenase assembly factor 2, mitochondrial n=1 Tax=Brettanomyces naardenensis TaxID=13370 RepID=A0A448YNC4_BRENA|nr:DEKNAAC103659 [Brettanomyces naardenensis]
MFRINRVLGVQTRVLRRSFSTSLKAFQESKIPPKPQGEIQGKPIKNYYIDEDNNVVIKVKPIERSNETTDKKRRRLLYQSRKRGILESDLILSRFADKYLAEMTEEELDEYDRLLDEMDWDIYYWATKKYDITPLPDRWKDSKVLIKLQELSRNSGKEIMRMPDLNKKEMTMGEKK